MPRQESHIITKHIVEMDHAQRSRMGNVIRNARLKRNLTQLEVAHKALGFEISHAYVSRLERAVPIELSLERLRAVAKVLKVPTKALIDA